MSIYAVTYNYSGDADELSAIRPTHREWLKAQFDSGALLASGPIIDRPSALLIFKSNSIEELSSLLDQDPFDIAVLIGERVIEEWNPIYGPFESAK